MVRGFLSLPIPASCPCMHTTDLLCNAVILRHALSPPCFTPYLLLPSSPCRESNGQGSSSSGVSVYLQGELALVSYSIN